MKRKGKNAISLIVLVITILVLSILAATVIISLSNTNIIGETSKTVLKSNLTAMQDMATVYFADNYETIDMEKEYSITEFGITDDEFKDYRDYTFVKAGKVYIKSNAPEDIQEVAEELNMLIDGVSSSTGEVAVEKTVKTLRIYGNTESTGSVGEKSKNLFDWKFPNESAYLVTNEFRGDNLSLSITDKDTTVDISGIYLAFTDTQTYRFNLAQYLISDGTIAKTVVSNSSTYKYLAVYPATQETVNKLNARFNIQVEEGSTATDYEPYGYKIPVKARGKNLIPYPYADTTKTAEGVTFTDNGDGSITVSGTATGYAAFGLTSKLEVSPDKEYTLSFYGNSTNLTLELAEYNSSNDVIKTNEVNVNVEQPFTFTTLSETNYIRIIIKRVANNICSGTIKVQLEEGTTATEYESYIEPTTYNIYLTEPLRKLGNVADYIDCTTGEVVRYIGVKDSGELEVLSTSVKESVTLEEMNFEGVNHIFVDTTVTPSNIEVKY